MTVYSNNKVLNQKVILTISTGNTVGDVKYVYKLQLSVTPHPLLVALSGVKPDDITLLIHTVTCIYVHKPDDFVCLWGLGYRWGNCGKTQGKSHAYNINYVVNMDNLKKECSFKILKRKLCTVLCTLSVPQANWNIKICLTSSYC